MIWAFSRRTICLSICGGCDKRVDDMRKWFKKIPPLQRLVNNYRKYTLKKEKAKYFETFSKDCYGCFFGIFDTFEDALKAAPVTKPFGYNNAKLAREYSEMLATNRWERGIAGIRSYDYPVLYWLSHIFQLSQSKTFNIFDFGGNVGIHFVSFGKYLNYQANLKWTVYDLPEIVKAGRSVQTDDKLTFSTNFSDANGADIFFASGSIQYALDIHSKVDGLSEKPKHIIINRLGLHERETIVTLQNGGPVFYPQYVFNKVWFIESFEAINYELTDLWQDDLDGCHIPFHPEISVPYYNGLYFRLRD